MFDNIKKPFTALLHGLLLLSSSIFANSVSNKTTFYQLNTQVIQDSVFVKISQNEPVQSGVKVFYISLLNEKNQEKSRKVIHVKSSVDFSVKFKLDSTNTHFVQLGVINKNTGSYEVLSRKRIHIKPLKPWAKVMLQNEALVIGLPNTFTVHTNLNDTDVVILNQFNDTIQVSKINEIGFAKFVLSPQPSEDYRVVIKHQNESLQLDLSKQNKGMSFDILEKEAHYEVVIRQKGYDLSTCFLSIYFNGEPKDDRKVSMKESFKIKFPKNTFGTGLHHFLVSDSLGKPLRAFYYWFGQLPKNQEAFQGSIKNIVNDPYDLLSINSFERNLFGIEPKNEWFKKDDFVFFDEFYKTGTAKNLANQLLKNTQLLVNFIGLKMPPQLVETDSLGQFSLAIPTLKGFQEIDVSTSDKKMVKISWNDEENNLSNTLYEPSTMENVLEEFTVTSKKNFAKVRRNAGINYQNIEKSVDEEQIKQMTSEDTQTMYFIQKLMPSYRIKSCESNFGYYLTSLQYGNLQIFVDALEVESCYGVLPRIIEITRVEVALIGPSLISVCYIYTKGFVEAFSNKKDTRKGNNLVYCFDEVVR